MSIRSSGPSSRGPFWPPDRLIDVDNIIFGSEMIGAVRGIDPESGFHFEDTKRYIDALSSPDADKRRIFEQNARRVFPRLDALLKAKGK